jgi:hypothetical protein
MESKFENEENKKDFNIWLSQIYIVGRGINKSKSKSKYKSKKNIKYITVYEDGKYHTLLLGTDKFENWINDKIKEFKEINLLK